MIQGQSTADRYRQTQFVTADRGRILLLMFDGALKFLTLAEKGLREENIEQFVHNLSRAQAVIAELLHTLNHKAGGTIAGNLDRLYRFMLDHLVEANIEKSPRHVAAVRRILGIIASAYHEILDRGMPQLDAA
jgi:flagellar protein FliS